MAVVKMKALLSRLFRRGARAEFFQGHEIEAGEDLHAGLAALLKAGAQGTLSLPFYPTTSVHDYRAIAKRWGGPVCIVVGLSALCERVAYLRKEGFGIRVEFPYTAEALPSVSTNSAGLHLLKDVRTTSGAGRVELAVKLDPDAFLLLPQFIFQAGRFKPSGIRVQRAFGGMSPAALESVKVARLEAETMGFSVRIY